MLLTSIACQRKELKSGKKRIVRKITLIHPKLGTPELTFCLFFYIYEKQQNTTAKEIDTENVNWKCNSSIVEWQIQLLNAVYFFIKCKGVNAYKGSLSSVKVPMHIKNIRLSY